MVTHSPLRVRVPRVSAFACCSSDLRCSRYEASSPQQQPIAAYCASTLIHALCLRHERQADSGAE